METFMPLPDPFEGMDETLAVYMGDIDGEMAHSVRHHIPLKIGKLKAMVNAIGKDDDVVQEYFDFVRCFTALLHWLQVRKPVYSCGVTVASVVQEELVASIVAGLALAEKHFMDTHNWADKDQAIEDGGPAVLQPQPVAPQAVRASPRWTRFWGPVLIAGLLLQSPALALALALALVGHWVIRRPLAHEHIAVAGGGCFMIGRLLREDPSPRGIDLHVQWLKEKGVSKSMVRFELGDQVQVVPHIAVLARGIPVVPHTDASACDVPEKVMQALAKDLVTKSAAAFESEVVAVAGQPRLLLARVVGPGARGEQIQIQWLEPGGDTIYGLGPIQWIPLASLIARNVEVRIHPHTRQYEVDARVIAGLNALLETLLRPEDGVARVVVIARAPSEQKSTHGAIVRGSKLHLIVTIHRLYHVLLVALYQNRRHIFGDKDACHTGSYL